MEREAEEESSARSAPMDGPDELVVVHLDSW